MYGRAETVLGDLIDDLGFEPQAVARHQGLDPRPRGRRDADRASRSPACARRSSICCRSTTCSTGASTCRRCARCRRPDACATPASRTTAPTRTPNSSACSATRSSTGCRSTIRSRSARRRTRLLPFCRDRGIAVMVNRPFADGALFAKVRGRPLPGWAEEIGCASWGQFFLRFAVSHPAVTCVIPATSKPQHMIDNAAAGLRAAAGRAAAAPHGGVLGGAVGACGRATPSPAATARDWTGRTWSAPGS